ncbi:CATRA system-associated protein [Actinoplanes couchii]|uniref:CATRA-Associated Small Protein domain-containing protein n=1 Tax=Actinoplanes couchii TaxID=403638 RepID=A0ABQ3X7W9_9ACTN|nr:CATRA system-associated protein [Actinoplanes couchii]MDR6320377.1 hypothetical protein [Actinoplanes couchii]GID54610.1 hypothetical protein Aco03nite_030140 [Actinoplanes couchii]
MEHPESWDDETLQDAIAVLRHVARWQLTPDRWAHVDQAVARLGTALTDGDAAGIREAVIDLELSGPTRALRIGSAVIVGIPEPVLDRRTTLVHALEQRRLQGRTGVAGDRGQAR